MTDVSRMPLLEALDEFSKDEPAYFCIPGHRYERGVPACLTDRWGERLFRYDLTEAEGLDDLHDAKGPIREAENLAAKLYGSDACRFCVNGTTAAIEAMILGTVRPGEEILVARNMHKSALSGLILAGAKPVWILPEKEPEWGFAKEITPGSVKEAIEAHPSAKAVLIVSPTYYGTVSDIEAIAGICHENGMPLLVDAAHGSHLKFSDSLPCDALEAGADLVAMSLHKTAGAMTQCSLLHYKVPRIQEEEIDEESGETVTVTKKLDLLDFDRVDQALRMTISSSPSYVLMTSLDAARWQLAMSGKELVQTAVDTACDLRRALAEIPGVRVYGDSDILSLNAAGIDATRVVFRADPLSGTELKDRLFKEGQIALEMADHENAVAVVTASNTKKEILAFSMAVWNVLNTAQRREEDPEMQDLKVLPEQVLDPREAFFCEKELLPFEQTAGRVSACAVTPYPPGIPLIVPGEKITQNVIDHVRACVKRNIPLHGMENKLFIQIIKDR